MRFVKRFIALAIVFPAAAALVRAEEPALPTLPQQTAPWTPPETELPRFLVDAARTLFDQGLADPRGREYRSIRVRAGDEWGTPVEVATTGWALPAVDGGEPRRAVAWNGLVYPLVALGEPADLDADVRALIKRPFHPNREGFTGFEPIDEAASVALGSFRPTQVCLLLRLGRVDLAEALWTAADLSLAPKPVGPGPNLDLRSHGVSYLTIAAEFGWARFNRAVCAHLRGDDALALADARALDAFGRAVDARAEEMGFPPPDVGRRSPSRYLVFLGQTPALLADQERRARERANPPPPAPEGDKVEPLIRALDQIGAERGGGVFIGAFDRLMIVRDLIDLGDDAVEPLIQALRSDDRLTRCLVFANGRGPREQRTLLRVGEAAYAALREILKPHDFGSPNPVLNSGDPASRGVLADQVQTYWNENKDISLAERWYRILADDQAGVDAWLSAAENIVWPEPAHNLPPALAFLGEKPRLRGEALRQNHAPTVSELMNRRIRWILRSGENPGSRVYGAGAMVGYFASWDPTAAAPVLRDATRNLRKRYALALVGGSSLAQNLARSITLLAETRAQIGDKTALGEYARWIKTTSFESFDEIFQMGLGPLWAYSDDPDLAAAADWLFNDPHSPWAPLTSQKGTKPAQRLGRLIETPLIRIPAFRKLVRTALADRAVIGQVENVGDGYANIVFDDGAERRMTAVNVPDGPDAPADPDMSPIGAKAALRACDFHAWLLMFEARAPRFNPCWPEPKRNAALTEFAEFLKRPAQ